MKCICICILLPFPATTVIFLTLGPYSNPQKSCLVVDVQQEEDAAPLADSCPEAAVTMVHAEPGAVTS